MAELIRLSPGTITNALSEAEKNGLYSRTPTIGGRQVKLPQGRVGGALTKKGWVALDDVPLPWKQQVAQSWEVPDRSHARAALAVLQEEFLREADQDKVLREIHLRAEIEVFTDELIRKQLEQPSAEET